MSPNKTLYIRDEDMPLWERAEQLAKETRASVSQIVAAALHNQLKRVRVPDESSMSEITVDVGELAVTVGFVGQWLVEPNSDETRTREDGYDAGAYWGIAQTKRGRIAVYTAHCNERWPATLEDYDTLDDAQQRGGVPADIIALAARELGQERVIWRNI